MSFYGEMAQVALDLLTEFGAAGVLTKRSVSAYDKSTGKTTQAAAITKPVKVFFQKREEQQDGGTAVSKNRHSVLISAPTDGTIIDGEDTITVAGKTYKVKVPGEIAPDGGTVVVYDAVVEA